MSLDTLFQSITGGTVSATAALVCTLISLVLGALVALVYMHKNHYSKSFVVTLALLPAIVQIVIMMVNGNLGTGVAVMGAFSLIRFRSVPGSAREIGAIFFAMAIGLAMGMGYVGFAILFLLLIGGAMLLLNSLHFGEVKSGERELKITIPENLDYDGVFDDLFDEYAKETELIRVRTTNMGSLFELTYRVVLKSGEVSKAFMDALRCRNGNLNITFSRPCIGREEL